jgi:hypothetical protein
MDAKWWQKLTLPLVRWAKIDNAFNTQFTEMNFFIFYFQFSFQSENLDSLIGLQSWKTLNKESITVGVKQFKGFLPPNNTYIDKLCDVYKIYNINSTSLPDIPSHTSSNKYQPPMIEDELVIIHHLLTMFHPRPFLRSRFPPQGGVACVRAFNKDYLDISYRLVWSIAVIFTTFVVHVNFSKATSNTMILK